MTRSSRRRRRRCCPDKSSDRDAHRGFHGEQQAVCLSFAIFSLLVRRRTPARPISERLQALHQQRHARPGVVGDRGHDERAVLAAIPLDQLLVVRAAIDGHGHVAQDQQVPGVRCGLPRRYAAGDALVGRQHLALPVVPEGPLPAAAAQLRRSIGDVLLPVHRVLNALHQRHGLAAEGNHARSPPCLTLGSARGRLWLTMEIHSFQGMKKTALRRLDHQEFSSFIAKGKTGAHQGRGPASARTRKRSRERGCK